MSRLSNEFLTTLARRSVAVLQAGGVRREADDGGGPEKEHLVDEHLSSGAHHNNHHLSSSSSRRRLDDIRGSGRLDDVVGVGASRAVHAHPVVRAAPGLRPRRPVRRGTRPGAHVRRATPAAQDVAGVWVAQEDVAADAAPPHDHPPDDKRQGRHPCGRLWAPPRRGRVRWTPILRWLRSVSGEIFGHDRSKS